jgi:hypothetical protein
VNYARRVGVGPFNAPGRVKLESHRRLFSPSQRMRPGGQRSSSAPATMRR